MAFFGFLTATFLHQGYFGWDISYRRRCVNVYVGNKVECFSYKGKWSMHSDAFKRSLGSIIISALNFVLFLKIFTKAIEYKNTSLYV